MKTFFVAVLLMLANYQFAFCHEKHAFVRIIDSLIIDFKNHTNDNSKIDILIEITSRLKNNNPDSALFYINKAEYLAKKNNYDSLLTEIYSEKGIVYWNKSEYIKTTEFLRKSLQLAEKFKDSLQIINALFNLANVQVTQGKYTSSMLYFNKVLNYLSKTDTIIIAKTYNAIGNVYLFQNENFKALEQYTKAISLLEKVNSPIDYSLSLNNIGIIYYNQKDLEKALQFYHKSVEIKESVNDLYGMAQCYNNIAIIYDELENLIKAKDFYIKALTVFRQIDNKSSVSGVLLNLGELEYKNGNYDIALKYYNEALSMQEGLVEKKGLIYSYSGIGKIYKKKGNIIEAIKNIKIAIQYANSLNAKRELLDQYQTLADIYIDMKDYKHASDYFKLVTNLQNEVYNKENAEKIAEMQSKYEFQTKEKEIDLLKKTKQLDNLALKTKEALVQKQKAIMRSLIASLIIFIVFSIIVIRLYLYKRKTASVLLKQKDEISQQKEKLLSQSELLQYTNHILEKKNTQITDSIAYAEKIQFAILPSTNEIISSFSDAFVIFLPKNIVSGDFYWYKKFNNAKYIAVVDCTGHGVPGAFMSMIATTLLNEVVVNVNKSTSQIVNELNIGIKNAFNKSDKSSDDGLEITLCRTDSENIQISSTNQSVYVVNGVNLQIISPDILSVGGLFSPSESQNYIQNNVIISPDTILYLHTDGYSDQLGGNNRKKYSEKKLIDLIDSVKHENFTSQKNKIINSLNEWKGINDQTDDICIIGFKI